MENGVGSGGVRGERLVVVNSFSPPPPQTLLPFPIILIPPAGTFPAGCESGTLGRGDRLSPLCSAPPKWKDRDEQEGIGKEGHCALGAGWPLWKLPLVTLGPYSSHILVRG